MSDLNAQLDKVQDLLKSLEGKKLSELEIELMTHLRWVVSEENPMLKRSLAQRCFKERAEGNGGCGACSICCAELKLEVKNMDLLRSDNERLHNDLDKKMKHCLPGVVDIREFLVLHMAGVIAENDQTMAARLMSDWILNYVRTNQWWR